jgi:cell wall-associated NlpC family hydrolase
MSTKRSIARHRAVPTRSNPLVTASRAVTAGASVAGKPAAVVVAASGLLLGAALPASAAGEVSFASAGQTVAATSTVVSAPAASYTVQSGDTLGSIAAAHGVSLVTVFAANGLGANSVIYPGQSISLSGVAVAPQTAPVAPAVTAPAVAAPAVSLQSAGNITGLSTQSAASIAPPAPAAGPSPVAASGIAATAMQGLGSGYVYGGTARGAWDCSGFVQWVYAQHGISLPRVASAQAASLRPTSNPQPGDLVSQNGGSHIGIYLGNGQMISALNPAQGTLVHPVSAMSVDGYFTR